MHVVLWFIFVHVIYFGVSLGKVDTVILNVPMPVSRCPRE